MNTFSNRAAVAMALLGGASLTAQAAEFATVVSSTPVTANVPVARQSCTDGQQLVQQRPTGAGSVIGAIAGGVIGNSIGGGFGRAAATGLGVVAGSVVGNQVEAANSPVTEVPVRRCQTVSTYETRVVGYDVMYDYAGQRYSTRMARDPGQQFAVSVQPADSGNLPAPTDRAAEGTPVPSNTAPQTVYYAPPPTVYYDPYPQSVYYSAPPFYIAPVIGFGFGYYGGYHGHRHWR
jgi:uncharacterized protein YcfJ